MSDEDVVTPRLEELPDEVEQKGAAQVSSPPKPTRAPKKKRSRRCPMCCGKFMAFFVFGIIVVPVAVFTISAFFALILWGLECSEARPRCQLLCLALPIDPICLLSKLCFCARKVPTCCFELVEVGPP